MPENQNKMRIIYTILAVLLIGATVFTFMLKEDSKPSEPTSQATGQVNPPHGQPGHKCELPVGAPLNGTAKPASAGQNNQVKPVTGPAVTASPKTNPAHGMPGHRCDLAVGAAL